MNVLESRLRLCSDVSHSLIDTVQRYLVMGVRNQFGRIDCLFQVLDEYFRVADDPNFRPKKNHGRGNALR
jgi:hypothetical protein